MSRASFTARLFPLFVGASLVAGSARAAQAPADARTLKNPVNATAESIAAGQAAYGKYCSKSCHGADAKGGALAVKGTNPPDLTDGTWTNGGTDGEIFSSIRYGVGPKFDMKAFRKDKISDTDVWNIVNYLRSIGKK